MKKTRFTIWLNEEQIEWLEDQVRKGTFKNISEGIRQCIMEVQRGKTVW